MLRGGKGEEGSWKFFALKDFAEIPMEFLQEDSNIIQSCKDGYIVTRVLEKTEPGDTYFPKKTAYCYITKEDAKAGKETLTEFYTKIYN